MGFTDEEVRRICDEQGLRYEGMRDFYDGYRLSNRPSAELVEDPGGSYETFEVYNPFSVVGAATSRVLEPYWGQSETYEALAEYIRMDFDGLRQKVALMMEGGRVAARLTTYQNDMSTFHSVDDVIALLVHLGYLGWDRDAGEAFIPNREIFEVFRGSTAGPSWALTFAELRESRALVGSVVALDAAAVAAGMEAVHDRASNRDYNSESVMSYAIRFALFAALAEYTEIPELESGKGFVDACYLPKPGRPELPALVVELKWAGTTSTALDQIRAQLPRPARTLSWQHPVRGRRLQRAGQGGRP